MTGWPPKGQDKLRPKMQACQARLNSPSGMSACPLFRSRRFRVWSKLLRRPLGRCLNDVRGVWRYMLTTKGVKLGLTEPQLRLA
jgi:hypothetical protein